MQTSNAARLIFQRELTFSHYLYLSGRYTSATELPLVRFKWWRRRKFSGILFWTLVCLCCICIILRKVTWTTEYCLFLQCSGAYIFRPNESPPVIVSRSVNLFTQLMIHKSIKSKLSLPYYNIWCNSWRFLWRLSTDHLFMKFTRNSVHGSTRLHLILTGMLY